MLASLGSLGYVLAALLLLSLLIMVHEFGHYYVARRCGIAVREFALGMGPKVWSHKGKNGTLFSLRAFPLGGFCAYYGEDQDLDDPRAYNKQKTWKRFLSILAGPGMNFVAGFLIAVILFAVVGLPTTIPAIDKVIDASAAQAAGFMPGDELVRVNGVAVTDTATVSKQIGESEGKAIAFEVLRQGQTVELTASPRYDEAAQRYLVGVEFQRGPNYRLPFGESIVESGRACVNSVTSMFKVLGGLVTGAVSTDQVSGPVGTINVIQQETRSGGMTAYLQLAVLISINLGLMNLLPLPALDGSRLVFCIIEGIFRRPVNRNVEGMIHLVGFAALMGLMLLFTYKDILAIFGAK